MKKPFIVLFTAVTIIFLYILTVESYFYPYPEIDTEFAPNFSWNNFNQVQPGMSKEEVRQLLGEPVHDIFSSDHYWQYSKDNKFKIHDFAWILAAVSFDESTGQVTGTQRKVFRD
jgi:DNA phosphorothioation-dependent restriction protein DptG